MELIDLELKEIEKLYRNGIENLKLITCMNTLVRVEIKQTQSRYIIICIRFPKDYPKQHLLVELKSKTLSEKFLNGLTHLCEQKAKELLGEPQIIYVLSFLSNYLKENPLCIIFDEIHYIKKLLNEHHNNDDGELKLKQKASQVSLNIKGGNYYFKVKILIPEEYPTKCISWTDHNSNLPQVLLRYLNGQAKEIARQCVEPPLRKSSKPIEFKIKPSFECTVEFLIKATGDFHKEICPICNCKCLPEDPLNIMENDTDDMYVERVHCGHIYHQGCLKTFMRSPPFPVGGKLCPALKRHPRSDNKLYINRNSSITLNNNNNNTTSSLRKNTTVIKDGTGDSSSSSSTSSLITCGLPLSHDRWGLNIKLAEARWAQQQARVRELEEVIDFLQ